MRFEKIVAAINAGDVADAERLCSMLLPNHPGDEDLLLLLAISQQLQGKSAEAVVTYAKLVAVNSDNAAYRTNYATALREAGQLALAEEHYAAAIEADPGNAFARVQLGLMLIARQEYVAARRMLLDAFDLDRSSPPARIHAAHACSLCQDFHGAEDLLRPWREWMPLNDDHLQLELSRLLLQLGDAEGTLTLLEDVVRRDAGNVEAKLLLANVYERMNRLDDAASVATAVIAMGTALEQTRTIEARHLLSKLALRRGSAAQARSLLEHAGPRHPGDYTHYFELAEACDKLGDLVAAMEALRTAHALQTQELRIGSPEHFAADAEALPAELIRAGPVGFARWPRLDAPDALHSPVFIVGFPRSGTTLLEQMLDAHPSLQSMDENPFFNRLADKLRGHNPRILENLELLQQRDCDELRKAYLLMVSETIRRRWDSQLVDKNPLNMLWLPLIHRLFPKAKFIFALRHPCDVILSCYMQNFRSSVLASASESLVRLASAYVQAVEHWLRDVELFQPDVMVSRYEELVADFPRQAQRIAEFLNLEEAEPMLGFDRHARSKSYIATPSYSQVIVPVNSKGMNRWQRYRDEFRPVLPILEPLLERWKYASAAD